MSVDYLIYISSANSFIGRSDINKILRSAKEYNSEHNITGILLYNEGFFLQMLEGQRSALDKIFAKIKLDPRHTCFDKPLNGTVSERFFPHWSMGFSQFDKVSERSRIDDLTKQINKITDQQNPHEVEDILDFLHSFSPARSQ